MRQFLMISVACWMMNTQVMVGQSNESNPPIQKADSASQYHYDLPPGVALRRVGGGVSPPIVIHTVEPKFSKEARKAKVGGNVLVGIWIDTNGFPQGVHIVRGVGFGLDEEAIKAVKQYRFSPSMEGGHPVAVSINVAVNFQVEQ